MKHLVYVVPFSAKIAGGVQKKILRQISAFKANGCEVAMVRPWSRSKLGGLAETTLAGIKPVLRGRNLYVRHAVYTTPLVLLAKGLRRNIVLEVNGNLVEEVSGWKKPLQKLCDRMSFTRASAIIAVSDGVAAYVKGVRGVSEEKIHVVPNPAPTAPGYIPKKVETGGSSLLYMGTMQPFHGVDRLLKAMLVSPLQETKLYCLGQGPCENEWRELAIRLGLSDRVFFQGWVEGEELKKYIAQADIGIGSLALDRVGLKQGSPLKTREYVALGLPTAIGYEEVNLLAAQNFICQVSTEPDKMAAEVYNFLDFVRRRGDALRWEAWEFGRQQLSFKRWAAEILNIFASLPGRK